MIPAKTGVAAEVPPTSVGRPPLYTQKPSPTAATSGKPRPVWLNHLAGGSESTARFMYSAMSGCWKGGAAWRSEKPPPEKVAPVGMKALVAPTAVTYCDEAGHHGTNLPSGHAPLSPVTPLSPEPKRRETPRSASFMNSRSQRDAYAASTTYSMSAYETDATPGSAASSVAASCRSQSRNGSFSPVPPPGTGYGRSPGVTT
eukprot:6964102-Prymnesium_polylepis.3